MSTSGRQSALEPVGELLRWVLTLTLTLITIAVPAEAGDITTRASVNSSGFEGNGESGDPAISADGRYVAFSSAANNLVPGDYNAHYDVFVRDRLTSQTARVSVDSNGNEANGDSGDNPSISADGRYVVFLSDATNLVSGDSNFRWDAFVHDRETGVTRRVSVDSNGVEGNGDTIDVSISADGRYVAFASNASNLWSGDSNGATDVFVHDRQTGQTNLVSVALGGGPGDAASFDPWLSAGGRYVAFTSWAGDLVLNDSNSRSDVFVHDRQTGTTTRVSVGPGGAGGNDDSRDPSISAAGLFVAFTSDATNLVSGATTPGADIFMRDRQAGTTTLVSVNSNGEPGDDESKGPSISADGRYVAFRSWATNLGPGDTNGYADIFRHDRQTGETKRVSVDSNGIQANGPSDDPSVSADGRLVVFSSEAGNLAPGDENGTDDIFVRGPELTLEADPLVAYPGQVLAFTTYTGLPGNAASLWAVDIGGSPTMALVAVGSFLADGTYVVSGVVPGGLGPLTITFRGYCIGLNGSVGSTNDVTVSLL